MDNQENIQEKSTAEVGEHQEIGGQEKRTNRTFDQSEFDRELAQRTSEYRKQLKSFDLLKDELESLREEKNQRAQAEMTEVERLQNQLKEIENLKQKQELEIQTYQKKMLKHTVLLDPKYSTLPLAYKKMIEPGETEDEVKENAEEALRQFQLDFKVHSGDVGKAPEMKAAGFSSENFTGNQADLIKRQLASMGGKKI